MQNLQMDLFEHIEYFSIIWITPYRAPPRET